jgi:hypothetical protein
MFEPPADAVLVNLSSVCVSPCADAVTTNCCKVVPAFEQPAPDTMSGGVVGSSVVKVSLYAGA